MDLKKYIDDQRKQNTRIDVGLTQSYMFQMLQVSLKLNKFSKGFPKVISKNKFKLGTIFFFRHLTFVINGV